jgi:hypothetical protein
VRIHFLFCTPVFLAAICTPALACTCAPPPPEVKTDRDLTQWYVAGSDAIFEGTVKRIELNWMFIDAKVGGLVPADLDQGEATIRVSFDATRIYKGVEQKELSLTTGIGGGDCGFDFEIGKQYLVYAFADSSGHLSTGICSGTALLEDSQSARSYLRGEQAESGKIDKNTGIPPTKLCGHVASTGMDMAGGQLFLFRTGRKSPIPTEEAQVALDGSFCIEGVRPGIYTLAFMNGDEDSPTSYAFFPGTAKSSEASTIELRSGEARSDLLFTVPPQPVFSVAGSVLISKKAVLPAECEVLLLNVDPLSVLVSYTTHVESSGYFEFPQVLPGEYWAFVEVNDSDSAPHWLTRKIEVDVNAAINDLSLELIQK